MQSARHKENKYKSIEIDGKEYIEKDKYYLCEIEEKIEKCLLYREGKRIFYNESFFSVSGSGRIPLIDQL